MATCPERGDAVLLIQIFSLIVAPIIVGIINSLFSDWVNHSRLKSGACENCPSGATTTICLDTAIACKQVLRAIYQSLYGPQVARRTYYLDTR